MRYALVAAAALFLVAASGCTVTYPEGVLACTTSGECPTGWTCRATRCFSTVGVDAGTDGATPSDANLDASLSDANVDTGVSDANELDAQRVDLGCGASGPTNADCPWYFGRPHAVPTLHPGTAGVFGAALSANGLTSYVTNSASSPNDPIYEASRLTPGDTFGPLHRTLGSENAGVAPTVLSLTDDGLELFAQVGDTRADMGPAVSRVVVYRRTSTAAPFTAPERIEAIDVLDHTSVHPSITGDGLELFFVDVASTGSRIYRTHRPSRGAAFEAATDAGFPVGVTAPRVTPDGLGMFVGVPARYATRPDRASPFGAPGALPNATSLGDFAFPTYVPATRELWYASGFNGTRAPWSPTTNSLWRVQVCRDAACAAEPVATCPDPSLASADGFHCYFAIAPTASVGFARTVCEANGITYYLATVHSPEELDRVAFAASGAPSWLGAERLNVSSPFLWDTGEPFNYSRWAAGEPDATASSLFLSVVSSGANGSLDAVTGTSLGSAVCEQTIWPTW